MNLIVIIHRFTHVDTYLLPCCVEMMLVDTFKNGMKRPKTCSFNKGFGLRVEGKIQPSLPAARPLKVTMLTSLALEPLKTTGVGVKGLLKRIVGKTAKYVEAKAMSWCDGSGESVSCNHVGLCWNRKE